MVDLVCIDVDGTLVGASGTVAPEIWTAAERVRGRGGRLALCSGRPGFGKARGYAERLDAGGWHVFQNGASVVHLASGESHSRSLPPAAVSRLIDRARETGRTLELYTDGEYAVESTAERARQHASLLGLAYEPRDLAALAGRIVRAQWLVPHAEAEAVLAEPQAGLTVAPSLSPVMPDTVFVNMTPEGVDKGSAVRAIAGAYGVPLDRVMMVGDGANDVGALRAVGFAVAMGNAEPEARAAAQYGVGHVDEGGLLEALDLALTL
jgi:Cof subfamily protein (haloacid dehalogenase superfamily)